MLGRRRSGSSFGEVTSQLETRYRFMAYEQHGGLEYAQDADNIRWNRQGTAYHLQLDAELGIGLLQVAEAAERGLYVRRYMYAPKGLFWVLKITLNFDELGEPSDVEKVLAGAIPAAEAMGDTTPSKDDIEEFQAHLLSPLTVSESSD